MESREGFQRSVRRCYSRIVVLLSTESAGEPTLGMASTDLPQQENAQIGQGIALVMRQRYEDALNVLQTVLQAYPQRAEAWFWQGLACVFAQRDAEALEALEHACAAEIPLSAVLFTPLRWTAAARPDFYQEQLIPFLQDLGHHASRS